VQSLHDWLRGWWHAIHLGALTMALALSPQSYRGASRAALARHVVLGLVPHLLTFAVLASLISVVIIRIVVVTAVSYGLSQYALEMVVRVLVLELIPLTAALFVALRCTIPNALELARMRTAGTLRSSGNGLDPLLLAQIVPRVLAGNFAMVMTAATACVLTLVLAYVTVYGFTIWAFDGYTRTVGRVFDPAVSLIFALKVVFLSLAVSSIPMSAAVHGQLRPRSRIGLETAGVPRLLLALLLIEGFSLIGNYY